MKKSFMRMLAMLLASLSLLSALTLTASAEMYSGRYNNLYYTTRLTISSDKTTATAKMTYEGVVELHATGTIYYKWKSTGVPVQTDLDTPYAYYSTEKTKTLSPKYEITRVAEYYYIGSTHIETMDVSA